VPIDLDVALAEAMQMGASDLHLKVPSLPHARVDGVLQPLTGHPAVIPEDTEAVAAKVLRTDWKLDQFNNRGAVEVSFYTDTGRYRASLFRQRGSVAAIFRLITEAPTPEGLALPDVVLGWADSLQGLVIVGGPTGSGKSTTTAVLIRRINEARPSHIVTIEDPIEFLHPDMHSLVSQREIGVDAPSFHDALRSALRQDPDVILIGEVRDEETALTALRAAETGHLVLCTVHTSGAAESIARFIELFSEGNEQVAREMLAGSLVGVVSQRLVPTKAGARILNPEVLSATARVRELIREASSAEVIQQVMKEGSYDGMQTFDQDLAAKVAEGVIDEQAATSFAVSSQDLKLMLQGSLVGRGSAGDRHLEFIQQQQAERHSKPARRHT
jgi:twitching motility protein PilT